MATVDGIDIPDTQLCREITDFVRDTESELLFNHSSRVYYFGALTGQRRGRNFDRELLYAAAMFHDIGLVPRHSSPRDRFEVDGANAARDFLTARGVAPADIDLVWAAIALHTTPGIPKHMHPIVALLNAGVRLDVIGAGYEELPAAHREAVVAAYPREKDFAEGILQAFYDGIRHKPETAYGTINADVMAAKDPHFQRGDFCRVVRASHWTL